MVTFIAVNGKKISVRFFDYYEGIKNVATVKGVTREIYLAKFLNDKKATIQLIDKIKDIASYLEDTVIVAQNVRNSKTDLPLHLANGIANVYKKKAVRMPYNFKNNSDILLVDDTMRTGRTLRKTIMEIQNYMTEKGYIYTIKCAVLAVSKEFTYEKSKEDDLKQSKKTEKTATKKPTQKKPAKSTA